jgi:lysophospholipase L1-like esterase
MPGRARFAFSVLRRLLSVVTKSAITTVIFFGGAEAALRGVYVARTAMVRVVALPYALGDDYGPTPPWNDALEILVPDDTLIWRSVANAHRTYVDIFTPARTESDRLALLRRFNPTLPEEFRANPTWHVDLNSVGYRTGEYAQTKSDAFRIACIGDSWTFGMNVDQDQTYPSRLFARLRNAGLERRLEVLNFGALGYSSFQGLQLLKARVLAAAPDVLAIGFGMNDSEVAGYRDKDMIAVAAAPGLAGRLHAAAPQLQSYKLLKYFALLLKFQQKPAGEYIRAEAESKSGPLDYEAIEPWTRVSPRDYDANMRAMIRLQTSVGGKAILVDNELWEDSPYRSVLRQIAADMRVPLVDGLQIVHDGRQAIEHELASRLGLASTHRTHSPSLAEHATSYGAASPTTYPSYLTDVVFRVFQGRYPVRTALAITGSDPQLGNLVPNRVLMHDDGSNGDERAGDGVWSLSVSLPAGAALSYVYTNSGRTGVWEGMDVPAIRHATVPAASEHEVVYLPIETFGELYMQADSWHTNAKGYDLIADAVAREVAPLLANHARH